MALRVHWIEPATTSDPFTRSPDVDSTGDQPHFYLAGETHMRHTPNLRTNPTSTTVTKHRRQCAAKRNPPSVAVPHGKYGKHDISARIPTGYVAKRLQMTLLRCVR